MHGLSQLPSFKALCNNVEILIESIADRKLWHYKEMCLVELKLMGK